MAQTAVYVIAEVRRHQTTVAPGLQFHSSRELAQEWLDSMAREAPEVWRHSEVVQLDLHWSESIDRELVVRMVTEA